MTFPPMGNSDHFVVSVLIDFSSNSKWDGPFHQIAYDYSYADWANFYDHLSDVPWEHIFKAGASAAASEFSNGFRLEVIYISLIVSIRSSFTHLHDFQHFVLLA